MKKIQSPVAASAFSPADMRSSTKHPGWRLASRAFHDKAREYDKWFNDSLLFRIELTGLRSLRATLPEPRLEIGVGPGRFAGELGVSMGIDPALAPLLLAKKRGISTCRALGESLPVKNRSMGTVFLLFTLCFLEEPRTVLAECRRVLKDYGVLVLGFIPAAGPWGRFLAGKKKTGHPFYRFALFYEIAAVRNLLTQAGFKIIEGVSTLYQSPEKVGDMEKPRPHLDEDAGFAVLAATKDL